MSGQNKMQVGEITLAIGEVTGRELTQTEKRISELEKEATCLSKTDLKRAIECLRESEKLKSQVGIGYSFKSYLRLPKFLHKDGKFDEAIVEFERLIEEAPSRAKRETPRQDYYSDSLFLLLCQPHEYNQLIQIYEAMSKVYRKEKMIDKADYYEKLSYDLEIKREKILEKADKARKKAWERRKNSTSRAKKSPSPRTQANSKAVITTQTLKDRKKAQAQATGEAMGVILGVILLIILIIFGLWLFWRIFSIFI